MRRQGDQEDVADDGGYGHGQEHAPGARDAGADGLLRHVGGGVVPGVGPVGLQQREEEGEDHRIRRRGAVLQVHEPQVVVPAAGRVERLDLEEVQPRRVRLADEDDQHDDSGHDDDVPPDADLVEQRDEADAGDVEEQLDEHDHAHGRQLTGQPGLAEDGRGVEGRAEDLIDDRRVQEAGGRVVDAGHDGDLAEQVEPRGPPAPGLVLHLAGPVVEAAGRGVGRGDLGHRRGDQEDEDGDERPADHHRGRARPGQAVVVQDHRAGQDGDDAEADGEVAEAAHRAEQLLRVAQSMQVLDVLLDRVLARSRLGH